MRFEKVKYDLKQSSLGSLLKGPLSMLDKIKAPAKDIDTGTGVGLPGVRRK